MKIYKVGGAVRDQLLGIKPQDVDYVVVGSTFEEMKSLGYIVVGKHFPVFINPETKEEYALARKEKKTGKKHGDFEFTFTPDITLQEDLQRRDLTCNAIAYDEQTGQYFDYFNGIKDVQNKVLKHINAEHFIEDPLRVLRVCRFAAQLDFDIDPKTKELCCDMIKKGELSHLSVERIWGELFKALQEGASQKFFLTLHEWGGLKILMPEIETLFTVCEKNEKTSIGQKLMKILADNKNSKPIIKFCILTSFFYKAYPKDKIQKNISSLCRRLKAPESFKCLARASALYAPLFLNLIKTEPEKIYEIIGNLTFERQSLIKDFNEVCFAVLQNAQDTNLFSLNTAFLDMAYKTLQKTKATDMPNFNELPKDENFGKLFKSFKIKILEKQIEEFKKRRGLS